VGGGGGGRWKEREWRGRGKEVEHVGKEYRAARNLGYGPCFGGVQKSG